MLLKLSCLSTWLSADCHIIFITYIILLLQTQIKVIPIKFWVVYLDKCIFKVSWIYNKKSKSYDPWNYILPRAHNLWTNKTGIVILVPTYWLDKTHLCMKFHEFISSSFIVMAPDLKTRTRTDGWGDDSARAVVNRPSFAALQRYNCQERAPWRLFPDNFGLICRTSAMLLWKEIVGANFGWKNLLIYHSGGSFFAVVLMKIILFWLH